MMKLKIFQIDAFAEKVFEGNPAAVCPLDKWLDDKLLQAIAEENNLSETAFFVPQNEGFELRWFTPENEVDLCGHATLATAHVLYTHLGFDRPDIRFQTRSGELKVFRNDKGYDMDFPASPPEAIGAPENFLDTLGRTPKEILTALDYIAVYDTEEEVRNLKPDFLGLSKLDLRGVVATAPGDDVDFVSRCFFPKLRVNEDPVTGSAHCELTPYWSERLGKARLSARQISQRGGSLICELKGERVFLTGSVQDYMVGEIQV